jgi:hypothetical protein
MDVTRIAALASKNRKVADLVNPFTRPKNTRLVAERKREFAGSWSALA